MTTKDLEVIGMLGAGQMGGGIAQMFAAAGRRVLLWDVDEASVNRGFSAIRKRLAKGVEKGTLTAAEAAEILERIQPSAELASLSAADLIIEAVVEDMEVKLALLRRLATSISGTPIVATNTSSLRVTDLAGGWSDPTRFLGIHFFNPPTRLELVELVPTAHTDPRVVTQVKGLLTGCGKSPIVAGDSPGFIVNRLLLLLINESARMVDEGVATPEDIDTAMRLGALHPAGPLAVADLIGLDTCSKILESLHKRLERDEFSPADSIAKSVRTGNLGRKSGNGFFTY